MIILANLMSFECFRVCSIDFRAQNWICKHSEAYFCQNSTDYAISVTKCAIFSCFLMAERVWLKKCASATSKVISEARNQKKTHQNYSKMKNFVSIQHQSQNKWFFAKMIFHHFLQKSDFGTFGFLKLFDEKLHFSTHFDKKHAE